MRVYLNLNIFRAFFALFSVYIDIQENVWIKRSITQSIRT